MKLLIALTLFVASFGAMANEVERELTPSEVVQEQMQVNGWNYIWLKEDHGAIVYVFDETDPRVVCDLANATPLSGVERVINYSMKTLAVCTGPAI